MLQIDAPPVENFWLRHCLAIAPAPPLNTPLRLRKEVEIIFRTGLTMVLLISATVSSSFPVVCLSCLLANKGDLSRYNIMPLVSLFSFGLVSQHRSTRLRSFTFVKFKHIDECRRARKRWDRNQVKIKTWACLTGRKWHVIWETEPLTEKTALC